MVSIEQACLTVVLTLMVEVPVSAWDWVPRIVKPSAIADTIARFRGLSLNFNFITRSFSLTKLSLDYHWKWSV